MSEHLTIGFLPLVDACLPILAHEHGYAEEEGLALTFQRDVSWATVLDRLLYGHTDAAHLIAPLAIATTLGRGRPAQPLAAPFVLGLNGNAITLTPELAAKVAEPGGLGDPVAVGAALAEEARARKAAGKRLHLGVVHRYSSHNYMLRYWLAASGIRPDDDVAIATVAPPLGADAAETGEIDGACGGDPRNTAAVARGVGVAGLATGPPRRRRGRAMEQCGSRARRRGERAGDRADLAPRGREGARIPRAGARGPPARGRSADSRAAQGRFAFRRPGELGDQRGDPGAAGVRQR